MMQLNPGIQSKFCTYENKSNLSKNKSLIPSWACGKMKEEYQMGERNVRQNPCLIHKIEQPIKSGEIRSNYEIMV